MPGPGEPFRRPSLSLQAVVTSQILGLSGPIEERSDLRNALAVGGGSAWTPPSPAAQTQIASASAVRIPMDSGRPKSDRNRIRRGGSTIRLLPLLDRFQG